jgi:hypothetical protein
MTLLRMRLPASLLLGAAFAVAACAAAVVGRAAPGTTGAGLWVFCGLALAVGTRARDPRAALVVGPVFWLFLDGFVEHRDGILGFGAGEAARIGLLVACALVPGVVRGGWAWLRSHPHPVTLEPFAPALPPENDQAAWN